MADQHVMSSLFNWVVSTITTAILSGLAWLGIHTKRLNELNTKIQVAAEREIMRDEKTLDIQTNIKEMRKAMRSAREDHGGDMKEIRETWSKQLSIIEKMQFESNNDHRQIQTILMHQTENIVDHATRLELLEKNKNFKIIKS